MKKSFLFLFFSLYAFGQNQEVEEVANQPDDIPFENLQTFVDVFDVIKRSYVDTVDNKTLIENAIKGMLGRLDPYSVFMTEEEVDNFEAQNSGNFVGVGLVLDIKAGAVRVVSALNGSPAQKAEIQNGDIITAVNSKPVNDLAIAEIDKLLSGAIGSRVSLSVLRGDQVLNFNLIRENISVNSVSSEMLNQEFALIKIAQFQDNTSEDLSKEIAALLVKYPLKGIAIDLRDNAGGVFESSVEAAGLFLESGNIVSVIGRDNQTLDYQADGKDIFDKKPIIILINEGTASAAEIFAGALKDNHRAILAGSRSFGKGTVQTVLRLYHGGGVKLTTARYFTPSGVNIQELGISPDLTLKKNFDKEEILNILKTMQLLQK